MPGLLRWQIFATNTVAFLAIWMVALSSSLSANKTNVMVDYAPLWAIVALGMYAVTTVLYGVASFTDCPEAAAEIEQQVAQARKELKRRGILSDASL